MKVFKSITNESIHDILRICTYFCKPEELFFKHEDGNYRSKKMSYPIAAFDIENHPDKFSYQGDWPYDLPYYLDAKYTEHDMQEALKNAQL